MLTVTSGDMFETPADIRVNTVNCVGVMGKGIALLFKTRYPEMFEEYRQTCQSRRLQPGKLHVWKQDNLTIVNFPTKDHWRDLSQYEYLDSGLPHLRDFLKGQGPVRVTLPALGCGNGGLNWPMVHQKIKHHLGDLQAEIFVFQPKGGWLI